MVPGPDWSAQVYCDALRLVVSHSGEIWGAQRRMLDLRPRLAALGIRSVLACPPGSALWSEWKQTDSQIVPYVPVGPLGLRSSSGGRPGPLSLARQVRAIAANTRTVSSLIRTLGANVVQSHDLNANLEVVLAARRAKCAALLDLHDIVTPGIGRWVLARSSQLASVTLANSRATAATVTSGRVEVVNPGVDTDRFFPCTARPDVRADLACRPDRPLVGILGRVDPEKGIDVVVRAIAGLGGALGDTQLVVIGAPLAGGEPFAQRLRAESVALLGERVRFIAPTDNVPDAMRALDVLVNASRCEPFGRTVLEAQACGIAVVGTNAGGIPEFVSDGVNGLLVPPGDPDALTHALERVLTDTALRARLVAQAQHDAAKVSVENQAAKVAHVICSIACP